jgi:hypothetical protein
MYFELDHAQTRDLVSLFVPAPVHAVPNAQNLSVFPASVRPVPTETVPDLKDGNQFGVSSCSDDMVPYKSLNDDNPRINPVHAEQHGTMDVLQKLQELSLLRQEKAQSSISAKSRPLISPLGATLPNDRSNTTLEGDALVKDNTSLEQRCENDEVHYAILFYRFALCYFHIALQIFSDMISTVLYKRTYVISDVVCSCFISSMNYQRRLKQFGKSRYCLLFILKFWM